MFIIIWFSHCFFSFLLCICLVFFVDVAVEFLCFSSSSRQTLAHIIFVSAHQTFLAFFFLHLFFVCMFFFIPRLFFFYTSPLFFSFSFNFSFFFFHPFFHFFFFFFLLFFFVCLFFFFPRLFFLYTSPLFCSFSCNHSFFMLHPCVQLLFFLSHLSLFFCIPLSPPIVSTQFYRFQLSILFGLENVPTVDSLITHSDWWTAIAMGYEYGVEERTLGHEVSHNLQISYKYASNNAI